MEAPLTRPAISTNVIAAFIVFTDFDIKDIMILGASKIGVLTAERLEGKYNVTLIEQLEEKAEQIANKLKKTLVIHGDGTDVSLLEDLKIEDMDAFVNISKEAETPVKVNVFHDIERIDQDEFDAHLHMHEHNKMNRSLSDEERVDFMRESMANESEEPWTCAMCHIDQEEGSPYYFTQHGIACVGCFESFMGINEEEEEEED